MRRCDVKGCDRKHDARGMCSTHYRRWRHGQPVDLPMQHAGRQRRRKQGATCDHPNCDRKRFGLGYCVGHYKRFKKGADMDLPFRRKLPATCEWGSCEKPAKGRVGAKGPALCGMHYSRRLNGWDMDKPKRRGLPLGTKRITTQGYRLIKTKRGWEREHRVVMARLLGRDLYRHETVHHRNGLRADNRPENLELYSSNHGPGQRVRDQLEWAREIIREYGEARLS